MRGNATTGDKSNDLRLTERHAFVALRRASDRLAETPLRLSFAVRLARRAVRRTRGSWRRAFEALRTEITDAR